MLDNLGFHAWLPGCVFLEEPTVGSSTLKAVRRAYESWAMTCARLAPRPQRNNFRKADWYYVI